MALYISNPVRPNVQVSNTFKDNGNVTDMPSKISDVQIYGILNKTNFEYESFRAQIALHAHAAAMVADKVPLSVGYDVEPLAGTYFAPPQIGVSFPDNGAPPVIELMKSLGFSSERVGRQVFFRGTCNDARLKEMIELGADLDTYTPYGICSVNGYLSFKNVERIIIQALAAFPTQPLWISKTVLNKEYNGKYDAEIGNYVASAPPLEGNAYDKIVIDLSKETLKVYGIVCPYFDGMSLPDKEYMSSQITTRYSSNTGADRGLLPIILNGWRSVCNTKPGMQVSHLAFCIDLALQSGARPFMLIDATGDYRGTLLRGKKIRIFKNRTLHPVMSPSEMREHLESLNSHGSSLRKLVAFINELPPTQREEIKGRVISEELFKTPRAIHNVLRKLKIDANDAIALKDILKGMTFKQNYWSPTDTTILSRLPALLSSGEYLDDSLPILYRDLSVMLTSSLTLSTLSAFGSIAPVFSNKVGQIIQIPIYSKDDRSSFVVPRKGQPKPLMTSVPVFTLPLQDASSIWKDTLFKGFIRVTLHNGKATGARTWIAGRSAPGVEIARQLQKHCHVPTEAEKATGSGIKRKAEDTGMSVAERTAKRIKATSGEVLIGLESLGLISRPAPVREPASYAEESLHSDDMSD